MPGTKSSWQLLQQLQPPLCYVAHGLGKDGSLFAHAITSVMMIVAGREAAQLLGNGCSLWGRKVPFNFFSFRLQAQVSTTSFC